MREYLSKIESHVKIIEAIVSIESALKKVLLIIAHKAQECDLRDIITPIDKECAEIAALLNQMLGELQAARKQQEHDV